MGLPPERDGSLHPGGPGVGRVPDTGMRRRSSLTVVRTTALSGLSSGAEEIRAIRASLSNARVVESDLGRELIRLAAEQAGAGQREFLASQRFYRDLRTISNSVVNARRAANGESSVAVTQPRRVSRSQLKVVTPRL